MIIKYVRIIGLEKYYLVFLHTNLFNREGKSINNFKEVLPKENSELAEEIVKEPYNFDFLSIREKYDE